MKIILQQAQGEITEKKSRFIATLCPVQSQEEAEQFIAACKKKYWDARHNCSAYVIGENNEIMHSSDDGEPSGTAGRPMLSVLTGCNEVFWRCVAGNGRIGTCLSGGCFGSSFAR